MTPAWTPFAHLNAERASLYRAVLEVFVEALENFRSYLRPRDVVLAHLHPEQLCRADVDEAVQDSSAQRRGNGVRQIGLTRSGARTWELLMAWLPDGVRAARCRDVSPNDGPTMRALACNLRGRDDVAAIEAWPVDDADRAADLS